jgi:ribosome-binding factor A
MATRTLLLYSPDAGRYAEALDPHRNERLSESIREELEELIGYEMSDPRIGAASVTEVHLSPDLRHAYVRISLQGTPEEQGTTLEALSHGKHFLRHQLAERLQLHRMPDLHFEADLPATLAVKAPQILKRIKRGRPKAEADASSASETSPSGSEKTEQPEKNATR